LGFVFTSSKSGLTYSLQGPLLLDKSTMDPFLFKGIKSTFGGPFGVPTCLALTNFMAIFYFFGG
jgi:hypothetical protein